MTDSPKHQEERILWVLQSAWPNWVPAPELSRIALQYNSRIFSLRHHHGWLIANRVRTVDGVKHGEFRLGSRPVPSSAELRRGAGQSPLPPGSGLLFDPPPERHRDDG
jgi:hypothetical protein